MAPFYEIAVKRPLLVTGFRPFLGESLNPSQEILARLSDLASVRTLLLPVSFEGSVAALKGAMAAADFSGLLMLGQAGGRSRISLERVALNWIETAHPDEEGARPATGVILPEGPPALLSSLPLESWRERLEARGIPAEVSLSAGGYVCNHLLYHASVLFPTVPSLFTHVPYLPEQAREGQPSLALNDMEAAVRVLIAAFDQISPTAGCP